MEQASSYSGILTDAEKFRLHEKYEEPRGKLEQAIAQSWRDVFRLERVGRNYNFFEIGGNSVAAMELMEKLSACLGAQLPVVLIFQNPTPQKMAQCINALHYSGTIDIKLYDKFQKLREQQGPDDDIEFLRCLPGPQASQSLRHLSRSKAQFRQDLFVLSELDFKENGFFVEFGAADGINLSNTYLLEREFSWKGILAEPARCWHEKLTQNRSAVIETRCVWSESGATVKFNEADVAELSTINSFSDEDYHRETRKSGKTYEVDTISLNDLLKKYDAPRQMDYLSIDTEGSEFDILSRLDFDRYRFNLITCEHNFTHRREDLHALLSRNGYIRKYQEVSRVEDWYVRGDTTHRPA